jgi:carbohydrate binding protein with CBM6 domain/carbohydrate binding protein with CBM35 domain
MATEQLTRRFGLLFVSLVLLASATSAHAAQIVPGAFEAEDFDLGGEGLGYHENTPGNQGDAGYRTGEDVDIFVSNDAAGGGRIVKNFESGEWLAYTLNVQTSGNYAIAVRASTHFDFPNSSYYVQVDGINVTGTITLPYTGGWDRYQWLGERMISLAAGSHLLRIVAVTPYFNLNSIMISSTASSSPYYGTPYAVSGEIEAEAFDAGGEGAGYHDNTPGNQGDSGLRDGEDVDIFVTNDAQNGSPYIVKNLETGEWLAYTISVPTTQGYAVDLRASTQSDFPNPAYHLEVDGVNVTGTVVLGDTGGWDHYQYVGSRNVTLTSGTHVLKIVSERPYFMLNTIRVRLGGGEFHALPGQIEAEDYVLYLDNTHGNQGNAGYKSNLDPDIFLSNDTGSGSWYIVKNFEAGEWLSYPVSANAGTYTLELRASTHPDFPQSAYHVEVNGTPTSSVVLPDTGGWDNYQWIGATQIALPAGASNIKIVVDNAYFNLNTIRLTLP